MGSKADSNESTPTPENALQRPASLPWSAVIMVLAAMTAGLIASGAAGLLSHPLRHTITLLCAAAVVLSVRPDEPRSFYSWTILAAGILANIAMNSSQLVPVNVLGAAVLTAAVGESLSGAKRRAANSITLALAVLGIYRLAMKIGVFWTLTDRIGGSLGRLAGAISGQPLWVGATFSGLDYLILVSVFCAAWIMSNPRRKWSHAGIAAAAIVAGHIAYLIMLSFAPTIKSALLEIAAEAPKVAEAPSPFQQEEPWTVAGLLANCLPWNFPAIALLIHLAIMSVALRWTPQPEAEPEPASAESPNRPLWIGWATWGSCVALAAGLAVSTTLSTDACDLKGKKIVANEAGYLNWLRPNRKGYGRLGIGMYGMTGDFFEAFGADFRKATGFSDTSKSDAKFHKDPSKTPGISDEELKKTDLLMMIYPNDPWKAGQYDRIMKYVEDGGSMLVLGEHTSMVKEDERGFKLAENRFNELLSNTSMYVRFDSAQFAVGGWLHSYQSTSHPTTAGIDDERNRFGSVIGASLETGWSSTPLIIGRWGWADPGETGKASMMGNGKYDPGEKLGDLVLAAEENYGDGRIIAFGDTSTFTNGITIGSHLYTSRLYGYLASRASSPQTFARQSLSVLLTIGLIVMLVRTGKPLQIALAGVTLSAMLMLCTEATYNAATIIPNGRLKKPNNLAYIDTTHMETFSAESWRPEGLMGLNQTLLRDGYLVLNLPEFTRERIERAGIVVSVAPAREFTPNERKIIKDFVRAGGIFISTVGYEQRGPSSTLLADFGFRVGRDPIDRKDQPREPQPMGHFKVPYVQSADGKKQAYVRYHSSWPIAYRGKQDPSDWKATPGGIVDGSGRVVDPSRYKWDNAGRMIDNKGHIVSENVRIIANGRTRDKDRQFPVIIFRRFGDGKFVVIGDTSFAMNKNLERKDGLPIEGKRENADFWRWLLPELREREGESWNPLTPTTKPAEAKIARKEAAK